MTPKEYLRIEMTQKGIIAQAERAIAIARKRADKSPWPDKTRPAQPYDIKEMAIIWHKSKDIDGKEFHYWHIVEEPLNYGDPFKAYVADDGCRYGLDEAYVEVA